MAEMAYISKYMRNGAFTVHTTECATVRGRAYVEEITLAQALDRITGSHAECYRHCLRCRKLDKISDLRARVEREAQPDFTPRVREVETASEPGPELPPVGAKITYRLRYAQIQQNGQRHVSWGQERTDTVKAVEEPFPGQFRVVTEHNARLRVGTDQITVDAVPVDERDRGAELLNELEKLVDGLGVGLNTYGELHTALGTLRDQFGY